MSVSKRPNFLFQNLASKIASIPMILTAVVIFVGCTLWTVAYSFTGSRLLPRWRWVGLDQYERLWETDRWMISINNLILYGVLMMLFSLALGFLLAALLDQKIRGENVFRTIFLFWGKDGSRSPLEPRYQVLDTNIWASMENMKWFAF